MWRGSINWELIESQYEEVLRVVISIQQGKIIPSTLLKHLGTYSRRNKLYQALREIGRVEATRNTPLRGCCGGGAYHGDSGLHHQRR